MSDAGSLIDRTLLHYRIIDRIGAGGMGEVFLAHDTKLDREIALKVVPEKFASDPRRLARFEREAKAIAALNHPNIVTIHSIEQAEGFHFLTMELVEGKSLDELVPRGGLPLAQVQEIARSLTSALAAAHDRGIIHRDLKPGNIMLAEDGRVKVLDFGLAKLASETLSETDLPTSQAPTATVTLTAAGLVVGTVPYLSPEYLDGGVADHRSDIFSLGVVLYELLTGLLPFQGSSGPSVMSSILRDEPQPIGELNPAVPAGVIRVIDRCLAKDPTLRYQSATEVGRDLEAASMQAMAGDRPRAASRGSALRWLKLAGAAVLALLILAGLGWWTFRRPAGDSSEAVGGAEVGVGAIEASDWVIAVIPSRTLSAEDPELSVVNEGLALTLTAKLAQLSQSHALQVIPSSTMLESEISSLEDAQRELGVSLALNFASHRLGNRIRVNAQLVDVPNRRQITADTIDGDPNDLLALEEAVTARVLRLLRVELKPMEESLLAAGTSDPQAYSFFLKGQGYLMDYHDPESISAAARMFEAALEADPDFTQARAGLGETLWRNFQVTNDLRWMDAALDQCTRAVELDELDASGHACLGLIYNGTGRSEDAVAEFRIAKSLDPSRDLVYAGLAKAYLDDGDLDLAEDTYKEAISIRPHYWAPYNWLGIFYHQQGRVDEALAHFHEVVRLAPGGYIGYSNLGAAYYFKGELEKAEENFERALEIKPDDDLALSNLGSLYFFAGHYDKSMDLFERAVEVNDLDYFNWGNLADAYRWGGKDPERAEAAYRKAVDLSATQLRVNPNEAMLLADQAYFYAMLGSPGEAIEGIEKALELLPSDIDVQHRGAQVYQALGDEEKARQLLEEAVRNGYPQEEVDADPLFNEAPD